MEERGFFPEGGLMSLSGERPSKESSSADNRVRNEVMIGVGLEDRGVGETNGATDP